MVFIHPGAASNMAHSLRAQTWIGAQIRKQTDWLNQPSASCLTSLRSDKSHHIDTLSPRYHHIKSA